MRRKMRRRKQTIRRSTQHSFCRPHIRLCLSVSACLSALVSIFQYSTVCICLSLFVCRSLCLLSDSLFVCISVILCIHGSRRLHKGLLHVNHYDIMVAASKL